VEKVETVEVIQPLLVLQTLVMVAAAVLTTWEYPHQADLEL
jgi:hypothetical protein